MTLQQNIKTVIDRNFTETKDDIKEHAASSLFKLISSNSKDGGEVWVASRIIPGSPNMEFQFFSNEQAAIDFCEYYKNLGARYDKYDLENSFNEKKEM